MYRRDGYNILRDVLRAAMDTIIEGHIARHLRDVLRVAMVTIIEGRIARHDRCMEKYIHHGSRTDRKRVYIIRSDMHHYSLHCISLHCTSLLLVNVILCVVDLVSTFQWNL